MSKDQVDQAIRKAKEQLNPLSDTSILLANLLQRFITLSSILICPIQITTVGYMLTTLRNDSTFISKFKITNSQGMDIGEITLGKKSGSMELEEVNSYNNASFDPCRAFDNETSTSQDNQNGSNQRSDCFQVPTTN